MIGNSCLLLFAASLLRYLPDHEVPGIALDGVNDGLYARWCELVGGDPGAFRAAAGK